MYLPLTIGNMMNKDHKLYFWYKDDDKTLYMDDQGKVYDVKESVTTVKATGWKPTVIEKKSNIVTMLLAALVFVITFFGALNHAKADTVYYTAAPAYTELLPHEITYVDNMATAWKNLDALKDVILVFKTQGPAAANLTFKQYVKLGDAIRVKPTKYPVKYIETYNGFYLFTITNLQQPL